MNRPSSHLTRLFLLALLFGLSACSTSLAPVDPITNAVVEVDVDGITFDASGVVAADGKTINVSLRARNLTATAKETSILGGNCRIRVRLYDAAQGTDAWSEFAQTPDCQEPLQIISLAAGATETLTHSVEPDIGDGTYLTTVSFQHVNSVQPRWVELVVGNLTIR